MMIVCKYFFLYLIICLCIPLNCFPRDVFLVEPDEEYIKTLQNENPGLAHFEKKLSDINLRIQAIVKDYKDGKMPKERAIEKLISLVKERQQILNDPEYLAESILSPRRPTK